MGSDHGGPDNNATGGCWGILGIWGGMLLAWVVWA